MAVLAGIDFFIAEVLTWHGLQSFLSMFRSSSTHPEKRRVTLVGIARHPTGPDGPQCPRMKLTVFLADSLCCDV